MSAATVAGTPLLGRRGSSLAYAVGVLCMGLAVVVVAVVPPAPDRADDLYTSPWHYVRDLGLLAYLLGTIALVEVVRRRRLVTGVPARLIQAGYGLVAVGVVAGLALGEDPGWFFVLAGPGLLGSAVGFVTWAVLAGRRGVLPRGAAVLLGVGGVTAIVGAEAGTTVLIAVVWLYLAWRRSPTPVPPRARGTGAEASASAA